jgi:hypothetical protein
LAAGGEEKKRSEYMNQKSVGVRIAPFLVGILCFLLPFMQVSCGGQKIISFTGVQLVTGFEFTQPVNHKTERVATEPLVVVAFIALVLGLLCSLSSQRIRSIAAAMAAGVAFVAMILLKIKWDGKIGENLADGITINYEMGFWLVGLAAIAGLVLSFMRVQDKEMNNQ